MTYAASWLDLNCGIETMGHPLQAQSFPLLRYWYRRAVRFDERSGLLTAGLPLTVTLTSDSYAGKAPVDFLEELLAPPSTAKEKLC